jgi:hypothetical protein
MGLTSCSRHPEEPAKSLCGRCGDFLCAKCKSESPTGLCPPCAARAPAPAVGSGTTAALVAAILCALLSGGFLLATSALFFAFAKGTVSPLAAWNAAMGVLYFAIAYGLIMRTSWGYSWSLGTQRLNALIGGYYMLQRFSHSESRLILVLTGLSLGFHLGGWFATSLARRHFVEPRL